MTNKHIGSNFDNFLEEEGLLVDAQSTAAQRVAKKDNVTEHEYAQKTDTRAKVANRGKDQG